MLHFYSVSLSRSSKTSCPCKCRAVAQRGSEPGARRWNSRSAAKLRR